MHDIVVEYIDKEQNDNDQTNLLGHNLLRYT